MTVKDIKEEIRQRIKICESSHYESPLGSLYAAGMAK